MVTQAQITKLGNRIDQLAAAIDPDAGHVTVVVFYAEAPQAARHWLTNAGRAEMGAGRHLLESEQGPDC